MKISYDKEVDAAYIKLSDGEPSGVIEMAEEVNLDMTAKGEIAGIEILDASKKIPLKSLFADPEIPREKYFEEKEVDAIQDMIKTFENKLEDVQKVA